VKGQKEQVAMQWETLHLLRGGGGNYCFEAPQVMLSGPFRWL